MTKFYNEIIVGTSYKGYSFTKEEIDRFFQHS
jgi:hypothetical protein